MGEKDQACRAEVATGAQSGAEDPLIGAEGSGLAPT